MIKLNPWRPIFAKDIGPQTLIYDPEANLAIASCPNDGQFGNLDEEQTARAKEEFAGAEPVIGKERVDALAALAPFL